VGLWTSSNEGAKFWLGVLTELKNRGVREMLIACVDGLKGFPQAIESVFPQAQIQLCIVHLVRASLNAGQRASNIGRQPWSAFRARFPPAATVGASVNSIQQNRRIRIWNCELCTFSLTQRKHARGLVAGVLLRIWLLP
jgi:hypothetical protein